MKPAPTHRLHLALDTRDLERSVTFYTRLLGTEPAVHHRDYAKFDVEDPGLVLTLNAASDRSASGSQRLSHLGLRVADREALSRERRRLVEAGLEVELEETGVTCCYAVQDKLWVSDPDGNAWEVYRTVEDAPARGDGGSCCPDDVAASRSAC